MKKVLAIAGFVTLLCGVGIWALAGWAAVGLSVIVPLFLLSGGLLLLMGCGYILAKKSAGFIDGLEEGFKEFADKIQTAQTVDA